MDDALTNIGLEFEGNRELWGLSKAHNCAPCNYSLLMYITRIRLQNFKDFIVFCLSNMHRHKHVFGYWLYFALINNIEFDCRPPNI